MNGNKVPFEQRLAWVDHHEQEILAFANNPLGGHPLRDKADKPWLFFAACHEWKRYKLVGVRLATEEHLCRDGLSKRLRETLSLLLEGLNERQVAHELDLSIKTVHEYLGMLYKHFQVSSRAELLAYFIRRQPVPRRQRIESKTNTRA